MYQYLSTCHLDQNYRATTVDQDASGNSGYPIVVHQSFTGTVRLSRILFDNCGGGINHTTGTMFASGIVFKTDENPSVGYGIGETPDVTVLKLAAPSNSLITGMHVDCGSHVFNFVTANTALTDSTVQLKNSVFKGYNCTTTTANSPAPDCDYNYWPSGVTVQTELVGTNDKTDDPKTNANGVPAANSPLRRAGTTLSGTYYDYRGRRFHSCSPTIGAYEFASGDPASIT